MKLPKGRDTGVWEPLAIEARSRSVAAGQNKSHNSVHQMPPIAVLKSI